MGKEGVALSWFSLKTHPEESPRERHSWKFSSALGNSHPLEREEKRKLWILNKINQKTIYFLGESTFDLTHSSDINHVGVNYEDVILSATYIKLNKDEIILKKGGIQR